MKPKVVAVVQARMSSHRLVGKSLMDLEGKTVLERVVERIRQAKKLQDVVVATTLNPADDAIQGLCIKRGWECHRGIEGKVLEQFYEIAIFKKIDVAVRITGDCPLVDAGLTDKVVQKLLEYYPAIDYGGNLLPRSYPRGLDVEAIDFATLEREWRESVRWRKHVTMNLRKNYWNYRTCNVANDRNYSYMRWCVDNADDLGFARKVYQQFGGYEFSWLDVVHLLEQRKDWVILDWQKDPE